MSAVIKDSGRFRPLPDISSPIPHTFTGTNDSRFLRVISEGHKKKRPRLINQGPIAHGGDGFVYYLPKHKARSSK